MVVDEIGRSKDVSIDALRSKSKEELIQLILEKSSLQIPLTIFSTNLSPLTALVKYLKEVKAMSVAEIAKKLNRHPQTIWTIYNLGKKKTLLFNDSEYTLPLSIFSKNKLSLLETIVPYLMQEYHLTFTQIALILNKNVKTIWTCNARFKMKGGRI